MQNNNISFTSLISPVSKYFNDYPWTINTKVIGKNVYTRGIRDCTSCLISDGQKALLLHLSPCEKSNHYFQPIVVLLRDSFDMVRAELNAILVGSKNTKISQAIYNKFTKLLTDFNIPFSVLKNGNEGVNIAYRTSQDELLVSSAAIDEAINKNMTPKGALKSAFEKVVISEGDEIYNKFPDEYKTLKKF